MLLFISLISIYVTGHRVTVCIATSVPTVIPKPYCVYFISIRSCQVMSLGFVKESLDVVVDGIVASVQAAHENMKPGKLFLNSGLLANANINRSPTSYMRNPKEERMK